MGRKREQLDFSDDDDDDDDGDDDGDDEVPRGHPSTTSQRRMARTAPGPSMRPGHSVMNVNNENASLSGRQPIEWTRA